MPAARTPRAGDRDRPFTVAALMRTATQALEDRLGMVWVEGEIAGLKRPASGHVYFDLADGEAKVAAVMWRSTAGRVKFKLEDGQRMLVRGRPSIYAERGTFQLYVEALEPAGLGAAALELEQRKQRLEAEGLFDPARKRPLPRHPRRIGVVTSATGAAIDDILRVIARRYPTPILLSPTRVQGDGSADEIALAIARLARLPAGAIDLMIVGRGGGGPDDLAAFNEEVVVRAIAASPVPVISAVGHEIDFSLADLVADVRASTPTAAGELAVPERALLRTKAGELTLRLARAMRQNVLRLRHELARQRARVVEPGRLIARERQKTDGLAADAERAIRGELERRRRALRELDRRLGACDPRARLATDRRVLDDLAGRLTTAARRATERRRRAFGNLTSHLDAMSPLRVLDRGYAIARTPSGAVVRGAAEVAVGDELEVRVAKGELVVRVETVRSGDPEGRS